jgi:hypothetical protein
MLERPNEESMAQFTGSPMRSRRSGSQAILIEANDKCGRYFCPPDAPALAPALLPVPAAPLAPVPASPPVDPDAPLSGFAAIGFGVLLG